MDTVNKITADCFNAIGQLRALDGPVSSPELIHRRLRGFVDKARNTAREGGLSQNEADDIIYPIVALVDEVAMDRPELRTFWSGQPLQLQLFGENLAGQNFFTKLGQLRRDGRSNELLRVYYQCLLLGFQGRYSVRGGDLELLQLIESLRPEIERSVEPAEPLSPNGAPPDEAVLKASRRNPLLWVALGICAVAIAVFISLKVSLDRKVGKLADRVEELNQ
jgi:type VI secretion system protein ImpK